MRRLIVLAVALGLLLSSVAATATGAPVTETPVERAVHAKPAHSVVLPGYSQRRLHLKFHEGTAIRLDGQGFVSEVGVDLSGLRQVLAGFPEARIERLFSVPEDILAAETASIEADADREIADLNLYYRITVPTSSHIEALLDGLNGLSIVEIAYPQPLPAPPSVTPDFVSLQGYRGPAPDGIDMGFMSGVPGGLGDHAKIIDIEYAWNQTHEDISKAGLPGALIANGTPADPFSDYDHGTAVLGELVADDNGLGVTGLVPNASIGMVNAFNEEDGYDLQDSIFIAHQNLSPGDVMLIEQQVAGAFGGCGPSQVGCVAVEWVPAYYDAIVAATADGIIVVEAAGNGNQDLDDPAYGSPFPGGRPHSGAIIVGAGGSPNCSTYPPPTRSRLPFSTFGSRVDLQGWGECVATAGFGSLFGVAQANDAYTDRFSGTSSASPIVAAAAASLSSALEEANGFPPTPQDVRDRLVASGTPQDVTSPDALAGEVGPLPDLQIAQSVVAPPGNDEFATARWLSGTNASRETDSNVGTTKEPGEPDHAGNAGGTSVWYAWRAPATGEVTIDTQGSSFDTLLGVYTGFPVNGLTELAADDDGGPDLTSLVTFGAQNGSLYWIAVDGDSAAEGSLSLHLNEIPVDEVTSDFDSDGRSDILWRNTTTGAINMWFMDGTTRTSSGATSPSTLSTTWVIEATGDYDDDGFADFVVRNDFTGQVGVWLMQGRQQIAYGVVGTLALNWQIVGSADFDGDGRSDILWRNTTTGVNNIWLMNGIQRSSTGAIPALTDTAWEVRGTGDYDGSGSADILWRRSTTGQVVVWLMDGRTRLASGVAGTLGLNWEIVGSADFDGGGNADILWRNTTTGANSMWFMAGISRSSTGPIPALVDPAWRVYGTGDHNGDGFADILWRRTSTGQVTVWLMNGRTRTSSGAAGTLGSDWHIMP